ARSTSFTSLRKAFAKAPETTRSTPFSNLSSTPTGVPPFGRLCARNHLDRNEYCARCAAWPWLECGIWLNADQPGAGDCVHGRAQVCPLMRGRMHDSRPNRVNLLRHAIAACTTREWRNRQTRWLQVPVPARAWGFNSPLAHKEEAMS